MSQSSRDVHERSRIRLPAVKPESMLDVLDFIRGHYDTMVDSARVRGLQTLLTIPAHLAAARAELLDTIERQVKDAAARGDTAVEIDVDLHIETLRVIRWYLVRRDVLASITGDDIPSEYARAVSMLRSFLDAVVAEVPPGWLG